MLPYNRFRLLHALIALCFAAAWLTAESAPMLHQVFGYALLTLILLRLLVAICRLSGFPALLPPRTRSWQPLSPLAGRMLMLGILLGCLMCTVSGVALINEGGDPGLNLLMEEVEEEQEDHVDEGESMMSEVHETVADVTLLLVLAHLLWIVLYRRQAMVNMLRGPHRKGTGPD